MVFRLLRREARALLSCGEEWLVGGGSLHLGRAFRQRWDLGDMGAKWEIKRDL